MIKKFFSKLVIFVNLIFVISCTQFGNNRGFIGIGSNSVSPLIMGHGSFMLSNPVSQYIYQNTGSGNGYKSQIDVNGFQADFGMTSFRKNPKNDEKVKKIWKNRKLRTITYALDAIGIGVNLPKGMNLNSNIPIINLKELAKLYSKDKKLASSVTWTSLIKNAIVNSNNQNFFNPPIAIGIRGGKNTSGKSEAFLNVINKKLLPIAMNPEQKHVIPNQHFSFIDNFNDIYLENKKIDGSIAYYSLGQISNIKSKEIQVAIIDEFSINKKQSPNIEMVKSGRYKWFRPFNMIYSVDNLKSVAFANYLLSPQAQKIIFTKNFVPLNQNQIDIQLPTWIPDLDYEDKKGMNNKNHGDLILDYGLNI